jgi:proteasome alpha subunit
VTFDGFIGDHQGFCVIGGNVDDVESVLRDEYEDGMPAGGALALGRKALDRGADAGTSIEVQNLEVCILDRGTEGRKFRRLSTDDVNSMLES